MIAEELEYTEGDISTFSGAVEDTIINTLILYFNSFYANPPLGLSYSEAAQTAYATLMILDKFMEETLQAPLNKIYDSTHYFEHQIDNYISKLQDFIGVEYNQTTKQIELAMGGILFAQSEGIKQNQDIIDAIGLAILGDVGYKAGSTAYGIERLEFKTFKELEKMIEEVEAGEMPFTDEQLDQLLYLASQADGIIDAIEGGIELVMAQVEELIEPLIGKVVEDKMAVYDARLSALELKLLDFGGFVFDTLLELIALIFMPNKQIEDAAAAIVEYLESYINSELVQIWEQLIYLLTRIQAIDAVTLAQVQAMIDKSISEIEFPENGNGLPGPPGPMGPMGMPGPVGATGPKGEMGEAGEGQFELEKEITGIDNALQTRLEDAQLLAVDGISGVVEANYDLLLAINGVIINEVQPLIDLFTEEMIESIEALISAFETPEAMLAFLLDVPEGEETATYELLQLLIANAFELGIEEYEE